MKSQEMADSINALFADYKDADVVLWSDGYALSWDGKQVRIGDNDQMSTLDMWTEESISGFLPAIATLLEDVRTKADNMYSGEEGFKRWLREQKALR